MPHELRNTRQPKLNELSVSFAKRPSFSLERGEVVRDLFQGKPHAQKLKTAHSNDMDMITCVTSFKEQVLTTNSWFHIFLNNLATPLYKQLASNVINFLSAEDKQTDRKTARRGFRSAVKTLLSFYDTIHFKNVSVANFDPKSFRTLRKLPNERLAKKLINTEGIAVQPLYQGFFVIIHSDGYITRCFNRYGEVLHGFLYSAKIQSHATFEAIVLPKTKDGKLR